MLQAGLTLITIGLIHSENPVTNRIILAIFATAAGISIVLMASHSRRPFTGDLAVRPTALLQVMPEVLPASNP